MSQEAVVVIYQVLSDPTALPTMDARFSLVSPIKLKELGLHVTSNGYELFGKRGITGWITTAFAADLLCNQARKFPLSWSKFYLCAIAFTTVNTSGSSTCLGQRSGFTSLHSRRRRIAVTRMSVIHDALGSPPFLNGRFPLPKWLSTTDHTVGGRRRCFVDGIPPIIRPPDSLLVAPAVSIYTLSIASGPHGSQGYFVDLLRLSGDDANSRL
ncbi:hypothetical protein BJ912DRAFT_1047554 [Pholiota molesta]|nr:hypothetical protein BJ912DRAFT_1047554 [Pholiota molesta]